MTGPAFRATHFADGEYPGGASTVLAPLSIDWQYPLGELGTASVTLNAADAMVATIAPEDVIAIDIVDSTDTPTAALAMIVDTDPLIALDPSEESRQTVTYTGPLTLGVLKDGLIDPPGGPARVPMIDNFVYDYTHPDYVEDGSWVFANVLQDVTNAKLGSPYWPIPWADSMPDGTADLIGPTAGTLTMAPVGIWYGRDQFTTTFDGAHLLYFTADNAGSFSIDGKQVATAGGFGDIQTSGFDQVQPTLVSLSAGLHTIAFECTNYARFGLYDNPSGVAAKIFIPGFPPTLVWSTSGGVQINDYPAETPGMTPGNVARLWLESQQALGRLTFVMLTCTDDDDSNGDPWAVTPTISVRVGQDDGLSLFLKMMEAYADIRVVPGTWSVDLFNKDAMNPASGVVFESGNLTSLRFQRQRLTADELLVQSQLGWSRAGSGGRRQGYLSLGSENNVDELNRLATQMLSVSSNPREQTTLTYRPRDDTELPWVNPDFVPGCTATVPTRAGGTTTDRVVQISGSWSDENSEKPVIEVIVKDLILQDQERILRAIKALGG